MSLLAASRKLLICTLFALIPAAALAQVVMTTVRGTILGTDGKPAEGVEIKFQRTDQRANYSVKTKKDGKFIHATLPMGIYTISVVEKGEVRIKQEGVRTNPSQPMDLDLDLAKIMAEAAANQNQVAANTLPGAPGAPAAPPTEARQPTEEEIKKHEEELSKAKASNDEIEARNKALNDSFNAGMAATQAKDWNAAVEAFVKASQVDPKQHVVYARLGEAYSERARMQRGAAAQVPDYERAATAYAKAVEYLPTDAAYRNNYMISLARAKKMDEAKVQADEAIKLNPAPVAAGQVYRNLGTIYFDTNQFEAAEDMFKKAVGVDPKTADNHYRLGLVLLSKMTPAGKLVQPKETEDAFKEYLKLAPTGAESDNAKGILQAIPSMK